MIVLAEKGLFKIRNSDKLKAKIKLDCTIDWLSASLDGLAISGNRYLVSHQTPKAHTKESVSKIENVPIYFVRSNFLARRET